MKVLARDIRIYLGLPPNSQKVFTDAGIGRVAKDRALTSAEVLLILETFRITEGNQLVTAAMPKQTHGFTKKPPA